MRPFFVSSPISVPSSFRLTALIQITTSIIPSNILFHFRLDTHTILSRAPIRFTVSLVSSIIISHIQAPHHCRRHPLQRSISSLHLVLIKRFRWNQMYPQTYFVPSKTFSRNQMFVPMGFVPCKTFSRNEIENTRSHQQAICRPEKDLHPLDYVRAGRTKKAPKKNLRGFVIPIGFKPITF